MPDAVGTVNYKVAGPKQPLDVGSVTYPLLGECVWVAPYAARSTSSRSVLRPYSIPSAISAKCSAVAVRGGDTAIAVPPGRTKIPAARAPKASTAATRGCRSIKLGLQLDGGHRPNAAPDLRHEFVRGKRREGIEQRLVLFAPALEQAIALEQGDVRERGGAAGGMAGVGRAVPEDRSPWLAPERLGDPLGDHHAAQGEMTAGHAFREHDHVRLHAPALDPEPRAEATERADHRIDPVEGSGSPAQLGDTFDVPGGG